MKTIKKTVKQFIAELVQGGKPFTADQLITDHVNGDEILRLDDGDRSVLDTDQIRRALRDLPHVKRVNGHYIVKGRRVPIEAAPKPAKIVVCNSCHKMPTRNSQIDQELGICGRCAQTHDRKATRKLDITQSEIAPKIEAENA